MNPSTKIFVAEQDCESLVNTMLWLEQFPDFEVYGTEAGGDLLREQIGETQPDIIILGLQSHTAEGARTIHNIRSCAPSPALLLATRTDNNVELLAAQCDGQIGPRTALKEVPEMIRKALNRRRLAISAANMPMTKAG